VLPRAEDFADVISLRYESTSTFQPSSSFDAQCLDSTRFVLPSFADHRADGSWLSRALEHVLIPAARRRLSPSEVVTSGITTSTMSSHCFVIMGAVLKYAICHVPDEH